MDSIAAIYLSAFALGALHAIEVDHMVAVSTFVGSRPTAVTSLAFGVRWGLGHAVAVIVTGGLLAWSGITLPESAEMWGELLVGIALLLLGVWALRRARMIHFHPPERHGGHGHLHAHPGEPDPAIAPGHTHQHSHVDPQTRHRHVSTLIGAVHGLAGSAPVVALIPVALMDDFIVSLGYLLVFGAGTILAMGGYALVAGMVAGRAVGSLRGLRAVAGGTAVASLLVGLWWIYRAVA